MLLVTGVLVVRATLAWILTLIAGFAAFMGVATLVIIPTQVDKNRALYAKAERYAEKLVATATPPIYENHAFSHQTEGVRFWHDPPGGCQDKALEAPSDTLVLGFWDSGKDDSFKGTWWHCFAFPSGNSTLNLTATSYLGSGVGEQVLKYFLTAVIVGLGAWLLSINKNGRPMSLGAKIIWFAGLTFFIGTYDASLDYSDDEFHKMPDHLKWFDLAYRESIGSPLFAVMWFFLAWGIAKLFLIATKGGVRLLK